MAPSLRRLQASILAELYTLALPGLDDASLAARVSELTDEGCDRSTVTKWRNGDRTAPLALLPVILRHLDPQHRAVVLDVFARPWGLRVVSEGAADVAPTDARDRLLDLQARLGELSGSLRTALSDKVLTEDELHQLHEQADTLTREAAGLREALKPKKQGSR